MTSWQTHIYIYKYMYDSDICVGDVNLNKRLVLSEKLECILT